MSDSTKGSTVKKVILGACAAIAVAKTLHYLLTDDAPAESGAESGDKSKELRKGAMKADEITKDQVQHVLQEIIQSQEQMKGYMKELTKELLSKNLTFEQTYKRVKEVQPNDPLEKYDLSMLEFDHLLDKHQSDPNVRAAIAKIMGAPNPQSVTSEKVQAITVKKILDVHTFMLDELERLVTTFQAVQDKDQYDMKTVTIAAQAIIGSKVEQAFGITSEDIESAVLMYHTILATDQDFANINVKIQHTMGKLMGPPH